MNNYEDIINLSRPKSKRSSMSIHDRAGQFSPFSALTGYDDKIRETSRLTEMERCLDEDRREMLDRKIKIIGENIYDKPEVLITYYEKDGKKQGGSYKKVTGFVKKIDLVNKKIILDDRSSIKIEKIYDINSALFN